MDWSVQGFNRQVVLVVDDEDSVRRFIRDILEAEGYKVLTARHSVDALQLAAEYRDTIDLLLTDFEMKVFQNGADLATCFRILRPETRILLTSGSTLPAHAGSEGETWDFLPKPFSRQRLLDQVGRVIGCGTGAKSQARLQPA